MARTSFLLRTAGSLHAAIAIACAAALPGCNSELDNDASSASQSEIRSAAKITLTGTVSRTNAVANDAVVVRLTVTSTASVAADVALRVLKPDGSVAYAASWPGQRLLANTPVVLEETVLIESGDPAGAYSIGAKVQRSGSSSVLFDANGLATFLVGTTASPQPYGGSALVVPGIIQAENFDVGGEGVAYHDNVSGNAGAQYRTQEDVDIVAASTGGSGYVVNNFETGEWLIYTIDVPSAGAYDIEVSAASMIGGAFKIEVDGSDVSGSISVPNTGSWSSFQWVGKKSVQLTSGRHRLRIVSNQQYFDLDAIRVVGAATTPPPSNALFVGDFETGNFNQWPICQSMAVYSVACTSYQSSHYGLQVQSAVKRQGNYAARFEVRDGDAPFCCGERAELSGDGTTLHHAEGDDRWYQWSTRVEPGFPTSSWSVLSQWHADADGSPPVAFFTGPDGLSQGNFGLKIIRYATPTQELSRETIWQAPLNPGNWRDIKFHIKWSTSDTVGFVELWLNGVRQTFAGSCANQTRCATRTMTPGGGGVYFKQGYYRDTSFTTPGVVYHDGLSVATTEAGLTPL